jgi:hypothetical protein
MTVHVTLPGDSDAPRDFAGELVTVRVTLVPSTGTKNA